jgi:hypothetical protein
MKEVEQHKGILCSFVQSINIIIIFKIDKVICGLNVSCIKIRTFLTEIWTVAINLYRTRKYTEQPKQFGKKYA